MTTLRPHCKFGPNNLTMNPRTSKDRTSRREYRVRLRVEAIEKLGGACKNCGYSDARALQFDHINGGGHIERRTVNIESLCIRILADNAKYQLLCANCNWIKRSERKEHRPRKD